MKDITWINHEPDKSMQLFAEGKIDAFMGFAPEPQEMRAKKIGRVLIDFGKDRPWSQYFCCMAAANRDFTPVSCTAVMCYRYLQGAHFL